MFSYYEQQSGIILCLLNSEEIIQIKNPFNKN